MGLIQIFVRRRVLTTVLVLIAVILGAMAYVGLGLRRFPKIDFPIVTVVTRYPGASPAEVETQVTKRVEDAISTISGIRELRSTSQYGLSLVFVQFELKENVDLKAVEIRNKLDAISYLLPEGAEDPVPEKLEIGSFPVVELALYGPQGTNELYRIADEDLAPMLTQVTGVGSVNITGGQQREIQVLLNARKLREHRVPAGAVVAALRTANVDIPAGDVTGRGRSYAVRFPGRVRSAQEIASIRVPTAGGAILTIGDLAEVRDGYEKERTRSRFDGQDAVILSVLSRSDANEVDVVDGVLALLPRMRAMLPAGAQLEVARETAQYVRGALNNVLSNMILGIVLTSAVLFLFLKSFKATIIAAVVMPAAVVISFLGLKFSGFTLNILTLTGMALVVGVLVNNSILVLENIVRLQDEGVEPVEAATHGTHDIGLAVFSSTATNLVVFLPIAFMGEIIGRFFKEVGLTVAYATVVSLAVSFSLTPMMCAAMLKRNNDPTGCIHRAFDATVGRLSDWWQAAFEWFKLEYLKLLDWCLAHRKATLFITAVGVLLSAGALAIAGFEFMPPQDEGRFRLSIEAPVGTSLEETDRLVRQVEDYVRNVPHLVHYTVKVGSVAGTGRTEGFDLAEIGVTFSGRAERPETLDELINGLALNLANIPSVKLVISREERGSMYSPISVEILGDDLNAMRSVADKIAAIVEATPGTSGVDTSMKPGQPEIRVFPRQEYANRRNVLVSRIGEELRTYFEGVKAAEYLAGDEAYDVRVKLRDEDKPDPAAVERMFISSQSGALMPIGEVAEARQEAGDTLISRRDRRRIITVTAQLTGERPLGKVLSDVRRAIERDVPLPEGIQLIYAGQAEMMQRNFAELFKALATATALTFLSIAGITESFSLAAVIMLSVPVSLVGVSAAMLLANVSVNLFSLLSMVMLVGMVVNNAIVVIDYAMDAQSRGLTPLEAIRQACETRHRMIVMADMTTVIALVPLSLGLGFAGEVFRPLAVVQIGGVLAAGVLSLLVIPVVFVMLREWHARHAQP